MGSMSQINSYAKSNKSSLCNGLPRTKVFGSMPATCEIAGARGHLPGNRDI